LYQSQNGLRKHGLALEREALDPVRGISDAFDHAWRTLSSGCSGLSVGSLAGDALGYELLAFLSPAAEVRPSAKSSQKSLTYTHKGILPYYV